MRPLPARDLRCSAVRRLKLLLLAGALPLTSLAQTKPPIPLEAFPLAAVQLLESPFLAAQQTDKAYLLALDPDRLLAPYLLDAGLPTKAERYPNWENTGLDGHIGGHYLSALALMYAATGDQQVQQRLTYMVEQLARCQRQNGNGYVGGVPGGQAMWAQIKAGNIQVGGFELNKKWVPLYNLHKTNAGLRDAYLYAGSAPARTVLIGLTDWMLDLTAGLTDAQVQQLLISEHGGLNEVFADVAQLTHDPKYLRLAQRFSQRKTLDPLLAGKDVLTGQHANTQIPKVIGFKRVAEVGGDTSWARAANFFWQTVVHHRTVSIGGNSVSEHFNPVNNFTSMLEGREGPETCNTYNMLKLSKQLYLTSGSTGYLDYYERAMYNHILSSQHPGPEGGFVYFTPIRPQHYRVYSQPQESFWCCVGSGLENHGKYGELVYARRGTSELLVNLFLPSRLRWPEAGLSLEQTTRFPYEEQSTLRLTLRKPRQLALRIRRPVWVRPAEFKLTVNGQPVPADTMAQAGYATISRKWRTGDVLTVALPQHTQAEYLPDHSPWVSFVRGPIVLAARTDTTGLRGLRADASRMGHVARGPLMPIENTPVLVASSAAELTAGLQPVPGKPLTFTVASLADGGQPRNTELVPFYQIHDARYTLYWPVATPTELAARQEALRREDAARRALAARTVDQVSPGEQQPESDHAYEGEQSNAGNFRERHWRDAAHWFSYRLQNPKREAKTLRLTYFGGDKSRHFTILVNGQPLTDVTLDGSRGNDFYEADYELPEAVRKATALTVKFAAAAGSTAGGIYDVRLLK
ncbi:glycoside hydrolase family 127 protein [Hymenobacter rubidus]|uniref:glycoside hydrolase family 127 protein n=1 Tax=Hymenobacter rubidus TaxID=1441626 RepID=UPI00293D7A4E|nr:glycoside hydrolase family 127 protein [Hymenobacter rubidus]